MTSSFDSIRAGWLSQWDNVFAQLFPVAIPTRSEWHEQQQVIAVLNTIGLIQDLNHLFHPHSGGMDLTGASPSHEDGLLELQFGPTARVVASRKLTCEIYPTNNEWSYFRLDTDPIPLTHLHTEVDATGCEEVLEVFPGEYVDRSSWDQGFLGYDENGDEIPLPQSARIISRLVTGGPMVIFFKGSRYNDDPRSYDALHSNLSAEQFLAYIEESAKVV